MIGLHLSINDRSPGYAVYKGLRLACKRVEYHLLGIELSSLAAETLLLPG